MQQRQELARLCSAATDGNTTALALERHADAAMSLRWVLYQPMQCTLSLYVAATFPPELRPKPQRTRSHKRGTVQKNRCRRQPFGRDYVIELFSGSSA